MLLLVNMNKMVFEHNEYEEEKKVRIVYIKLLDNNYSCKCQQFKITVNKGWVIWLDSLTGIALYTAEWICSLRCDSNTNNTNMFMYWSHILKLALKCRCTKVAPFKRLQGHMDEVPQ